MNVEMVNISIKSHYLTILFYNPSKRIRHSLRSATWWTTLMQSSKLCLLLCNTRWWFYCNKKVRITSLYLVGMSGLEPPTPTLYSLGKKRACEWRSLRSATWWTTLMQSSKLCLLLCNTRWWFYCNKKSEDNLTLIGWNEWTRTTDPHLIRVVL